MGKKFYLTLILLSLIVIPPIASAINLEVEKTSSNEVMIYDLEKPAILDLKITNFGSSDNFMFYNLLGFNMAPKGTVPIAGGETKEVQLIIYPRQDLVQRGFLTFNYYIRGQDRTEVTEKIMIKIIDLKDAFEIGSGEIDPKSNSIEVYIQNKENFNFGEMSAKFSSPFFNFEKTFALAPNQKQSFSIKLNKEDFKKLMAGYYTLKADIKVEEQEAEIEGDINFIEKNILTSTKRDYGWVIITKIMKKTNEGNVLVKSETAIQKNIISRLFTSFSPEPDTVERSGFNVNYGWVREIKPGETLEIRVKTNWLLPLLIIFFVIAIIILVKKYSRTSLILKKRVSFVKAKGGEFALKVSIIVEAKDFLERVNIIDGLPPLVKIYEKFGVERPSRINEKARRIEWNFERLEAGETRILAYIIYSKVGILGKFALPSAAAIYEKDGKVQESESNRAFFVAEQSKEEDY